MDVADLLSDQGKIYSDMAISTILVPGFAPTLTLGVPSDPNKNIDSILKRADSYLPEFDLDDLAESQTVNQSHFTHDL